MNTNIIVYYLLIRNTDNQCLPGDVYADWRFNFSPHHVPLLRFAPVNIRSVHGWYSCLFFNAEVLGFIIIIIIMN